MTDRTYQSFRLPDGRTLTYAEYGAPDGHPVFYFHGLSGSRLEPAVLDEVVFANAGIRLIAPDRPGMGGSDFQPGRGFRHGPADVAALANALGLEKFGVWGVSGGGGYVPACAALIPERLTGAVIVSGAGLMYTPEARRSLAPAARWMWWLAGRAPRLLGVFFSLMKSMQGDPEKIRRMMLKTMPADEKDFFAVPGRLEAFIASGLESMRQGTRGVAWDTHLYAVPWDFRLEDACFPVRLLHGEADQNVPVAVARQLAAALPACRASFYPGEGHIPVLGNHLEEVMAELKGKAANA